MRLLHTSDWHVGRSFHGADTLATLTTVLREIATIVREQRIDVVLVAGDVYDSAMPAGRHVDALTAVLAEIRAAGAEIVLSSGNHDSAARLGANAGFARAGGLHLSTRALEPESWRIELADEHGPVQIYALPYLEPVSLRAALPDAGIANQADAIRWAMDAVRASGLQHPGRAVVLAHCFAANLSAPGGSVGSATELDDAPRDITAGGLDVVPVTAFDGVDYVALGHLHSRQELAPGVRYSGAPLHFSFRERSPERGGWLVELDADGLAGAAWVDLPVPRRLTTIEGELDALLSDEAHDGTEDDWLRVRLTDRLRPVDAMRRLQRRWPHCAEVTWVGGATAPQIALRERLAKRSEVEIVDDFLTHVRAGVGASEAEATLVRDALARVAAEDGGAMKLLRLAGAAFGPFRDGFEIDFTAFDAHGVYLIAGPTGAGKSTILDAITFALYGSAPRYEGKAHLRSDLAAAEQGTWVELTFAVGPRVLRVRRSPEYERPKQRGTGTTKEKAAAQLLEQVGDDWHPLSASIGEVGTEVGRILGLSKDEFLQVILLAQGGFAEFLSATSDERKQLLQRLFGTGSMRRLRELLLADATAIKDARGEQERIRDDRGERVRAAVRLLRSADASAGACGSDGETADGTDDADGARDAADSPADAAPPAVDASQLADAEARLTAHVAAAESAAQIAMDRERDARAQRDAARALADRFERRDAAAARLAALADAAAAIDADRAVLTDADRAAEVAGAMDRWSRADAAVTLAQAALDRAARGLPEGIAPTRAAVESAHEVAAHAAARAATAVALEDELPALEQGAAEAALTADGAAAAADALVRERAEAPQARAAIAAAKESAATLAAGLPAAERAVQTANTQLEARAAVEQLTPQLSDARARAAETAAVQSERAAAAARLQRDRVAGIASELAAGLVEGTPCPVCGSPEHPAPHAPADDAVTADDVEAALAASEQAIAAARAADAALADLERRTAAHEAVAVDDRETLETALLAAEAERAASAEAAAEAQRHERELAAHDSRLEGLESQIATLSAQATDARSHAAAAETRLADARERLVRELGDHPTAAALHAATTARATALRAWLDAEAERTRSLDEQEAAAGAGARALAEHELTDRDATAAMRLTAGERDRLRQRIRTHDDAVASARGVLDQPDLAELEGESPDLAPLEAAFADAEGAARTAARAATAASTSRDLAVADIAEAREAIRILEDGAAHAETVRAVAAALHGENERRQDIETYVLATRLGAIIDAANLRLAAMTDGRFALLHDEATAYRRRASGLGIEVLDAHTGVPRTTASLSGGETFLASLALALGLADVVQAESGGVSLETLFVDEGFGSLDQDTLEAAMATLDELRVGGRSVGVISHVQQMQERIPAAIRVEPLPGGGSRVVVTASGPASPA